jgi:hypothetical protein
LFYYSSSSSFKVGIDEAGLMGIPGTDDITLYINLLSAKLSLNKNLKFIIAINP